MAFGEEIYTRLTNFAGLSALVSTRVYPVQFRQQGSEPAIRYNRISSITPSAMGSDIGLSDYRYQFDIIAPTYSQADAVLAQLKAALQRWSDSLIGLQDAYLIGESDGYDDDTRQYWVRLDARFVVEETFP